MRIYRHALESIFAVLALQDLSRVLAVCREWSAAVRSMRPIDARIRRDSDELHKADKHMRSLPPIGALVKSPLLRHATALEIRDLDGHGEPLPTAPTNEALALLAQHAPQLTSLGCSLRLTPGVPLRFPASLTSLQLRPLGSADEINRLLTTLAALPVLRRLELRTPINFEIDWSLLGGSPSLLDLTLASLYGEDPVISDRQEEQIRSVLGHLQRFAFGSVESIGIARLLQPPVTMRWQDIGMVSADAQTGDVIAALPTLTKLDLSFAENAPHADFLSQLPLLTALRLDCEKRGRSQRTFRIPAAPLLASLLPCTGLTALELHCGFNSAQVSTLLASLTQIKLLRLECPLETLQCFASGPATRTLEDLRLSSPADLPPSELAHLFALKQLRALTLECFASSPDAATLDSLSPPSAILPPLTTLRYRVIGSDGPRYSQREGPSFESTQPRMTQ